VHAASAATIKLCAATLTTRRLCCITSSRTPLAYPIKMNAPAQTRQPTLSKTRKRPNGARVLLAPLAGLTRMPFGRFLVFDSVGCLVWAGAFILIGYASGVWLEVMQQSLRVVSVAAQSLIVAALAAWTIPRLVRRRAATATAAA